MIGIIDYGGGNLRSVKKAFDFLGAQSELLVSPVDFKNIECLVLPGVGSFGYAMKRIREKGLYEPIKGWLQSNRPFLGICLGLQLLFESSEESPGINGLGVFKGTCKRFNARKVPQIGWNDILIKKHHSILEGFSSGEYFYFVHGYYVVPDDNSIVLAQTEYDINYTSIAEKGNILGIQFHPEKSGEAGLKLLKNWVEQC